jgi:hypothetical protein
MASFRSVHFLETSISVISTSPTFYLSFQFKLDRNKTETFLTKRKEGYYNYQAQTKYKVQIRSTIVQYDSLIYSIIQQPKMHEYLLPIISLLMFFICCLLPLLQGFHECCKSCQLFLHSRSNPLAQEHAIQHPLAPSVDTEEGEKQARRLEILTTVVHKVSKTH